MNIRFLKEILLAENTVPGLGTHAEQHKVLIIYAAKTLTTNRTWSFFLILSISRSYTANLNFLFQL